METAVSSETLASIYQNARRDIQKQRNPATRHRKKLNWHSNILLLLLLLLLLLQTGKNSTLPFAEQEDISLMC
jgi:accessory gene regulator protein AgrB